MPTLTYPGVYIQEISSGVRPIGVASTSTAAFVGLAQMGPETATRVTNWTEFQRSFGSFIADGYLAYSVFQFFNNGGRQCYVVRVTRPDAAAASVTVQNRAAPAVAGLTFSAKNKGAWGNSLIDHAHEQRRPGHQHDRAGVVELQRVLAAVHGTAV